MENRTSLKPLHATVRAYLCRICQSFWQFISGGNVQEGGSKKQPSFLIRNKIKHKINSIFMVKKMYMNGTGNITLQTVPGEGGFLEEKKRYQEESCCQHDTNLLKRYLSSQIGCWYSNEGVHLESSGQQFVVSTGERELGNIEVSRCAALLLVYGNRQEGPPGSAAYTASKPFCS